jgi:hypothetical protein
MTWIIEAREQGKLDADFAEMHRERDAAIKARFDAEPVTPELLAEFMKPYEDPIQSVVQDLIGAGFTVNGTGPTFVYDSEDTDPGKGDGYLDQFALAHKSVVASSSLPDSKDIWGNFPFGQSWEISSDEYPLLGALQLIPIVDSTTHFGGVRFKAIPYIGIHPELKGTSYSGDATPAQWDTFDQAGSARIGLQTAVGSWIMRATAHKLNSKTEEAIPQP